MLQKLLFPVLIFFALFTGTATATHQSFGPQQPVSVELVPASFFKKETERKNDQSEQRRRPKEKGKWENILKSIATALLLLVGVAGLLGGVVGGVVGLMIALIKWNGILALWSLGAAVAGVLLAFFSLIMFFKVNGGGVC